MRIECDGNHYIIVRGRGYKESYFCFFIDHDRSSWTSKSPWNARKYSNEAEAAPDLTELRKRAALRREERKKAEEKDPA